MKLTLAQKLALQHCNEKMEEARLEYIELQKEIGLDPRKTYTLSPDGEVRVLEVENASSEQEAAADDGDGTFEKKSGQEN